MLQDEHVIAGLRKGLDTIDAENKAAKCSARSKQ
jgi:hypothetical protein